ncbi:BCL6A transcription repressor b [Stigmatopora nigra]
MALTANGCVQFTRHAGDVLLNFNRLRSRNMLTDITVRVDGQLFCAHKAVLVACSGFFYSVFMNPENSRLGAISLDPKVDPKSFSSLLDFMYTSRLNLTDGALANTMNAALYLQMEHVADTCRRFLSSRPPLDAQVGEDGSATFPPEHAEKSATWPPQPERSVFRGINTSGSYRVYGEPRGSPRAGPLSSPPAGAFLPGPAAEGDGVGRPAARGGGGEAAGPLRSHCQPDSPTESSSSGNAGLSPGRPARCPQGGQVRNWKKFKFIVMNRSADDEEEEEEEAEGAATTGTATGDQPPTEEMTGDQNPGDGHRKCSSCGRDSPRGHQEARLSPDASHVELSPSSREEDSPTEKEPAAPRKKPYKCDCCQAAFRYKGNLASHKTVHTGAKPYCCDICGAQFNRPANLKTHARIHSGEKPYKCDTCGSRFVQVAHLRAHVLIHTGEKPYPCEICGTHFRHLQTLKSHMRIHTGEKPYHCEKCDLRFRHKSQLRLHLRQKHGAVTNTKAPYRQVS